MFCFFVVLTSSWRKQGNMERKQNLRVHQCIQKNLGKQDQRKRKRGRSHGKVLWLHGGRLTRKASIVKKPPPILNQRVLVNGMVILLVQCIDPPEVLMGNTGVHHLVLLWVYSNPRSGRKMRYPISLSNNTTIALLLKRTMALFMWLLDLFITSIVANCGDTSFTERVTTMCWLLREFC